MSEPTVCTFKWKAPTGYRTRFTAEHVLTLRNMVARHYSKPHRFVCITDDTSGLTDVQTLPLWDTYANVPNPNGTHNPSCYRRLKVFAPDAGAWLGERIVCMDLDVVVTGDLSPLFDDPADFKIWGQTDFPGKQWVNGSFFSLKAGSRPQVWTDFDPKTSPQKQKAAGARGSDQGWISYLLGPTVEKWSQKDGIHSWRVHLAPRGGNLPDNARLVCFHGKAKPWDYNVQQHKWVRRHYN